MALSLKPSHAKAVEAIYAAGAKPELWPKTIETLADYLNASSGMLAFQSQEKRTGGLVTGRLRDDLRELYLRSYIDNPYAVRLARVPPGRPVVVNKLIDFARLQRTPFYADILEPSGVREVIALVHPQLVGGGNTGGFAFNLGTSHVADRDRICERMATLAPHLVRALDLTIELSEHSPEARQAGDLLNVLSNAAVLIDRRLRIVQANEAAEGLLAGRDGLFAVPEDGGLQLTAAIQAEKRSLRTALASAVSVSEGSDRGLPGAVSVSRAADRRTSLMVVVTPLPPPAFPLLAHAGRGARALVQIIDPHASSDGQAAILQNAVGLTPAEARVAALVAQGLTTPRVADALGLSPSTVRTHLSRCFDKTGARSQVALARLIASIPPNG